MSKKLLVVFGGTKQTSPQSVFDLQTLRANSIDLLQFNFLTTHPNVRFNDTYWLTGEPKGISRAITAEIANNAPKALANGLRFVKEIVEEVNWSAKNYTKNSDARGMTVEAWQAFSQSAEGVLRYFLGEVAPAMYEKVMVLAHSRGCAIALSVCHGLTDLSIVKRVTLLDPVGMNVGFSTTIIDENIETVHNIKGSTEVHIVVKSAETKFNYDCYADQLVGIKGSSRYHEGRFNDLNNIYVHAASGPHEKMLTSALHNRFHATNQIIADDEWHEICFHDWYITKGSLLAQLMESATLRDYIRGQLVAQEYYDDLHDALSVYGRAISLADRRAAFAHCLAHKMFKLMPSS